MFVGTKSIMTAKPAKMETPIVLYKKYSETPICRGADQITFTYAMRSISRCASTDIRFTISPAVDSFRALLFNRKV